jgi:hypothetical protein
MLWNKRLRIVGLVYTPAEFTVDLAILARLTRSGIAHAATISRASLHNALLSGFVLLVLHYLLLAHVLFAFILHCRGFD